MSPTPPLFHPSAAPQSSTLIPIRTRAWLLGLVAVMLGVCVLAPERVRAQEVMWSSFQIQASQRLGPAMDYDSVRRVVVLFGGSTETWTQQLGSSPAGLRSHEMAYETAHERVLLFGGNWGGVVVSETWGLSESCPAPLITGHPAARTVCPCDQASFTVTASGGASISYRWQWQPAGNGAAWADLVEGINADPRGVAVIEAADVDTATLRGRPLTAIVNLDPRRLRAVVTDVCGSTTSDETTLGVCRADFNCDEQLNSGDFFDFLSAFFTDAPGADFDHNDVVNSQDFFEFLAAFFVGC